MWAGYPSTKDIEEVFGDGFRIHTGFAWGAGNSAYQTEGGLNGPKEPLNNWWEWERSGRVEPTGKATGFYERYEEDFKISRKIGLNHFRLGLEWARIQPRYEPGISTPPEVDRTAIEHYAKMIAAVRKHGMEPVVTLHHFTHPAWMGRDMWLYEDNLELLREYFSTAVLEINEALIQKHGQRPVPIWETTNEPNVVASASYLLGQFPSGKKGIQEYFTALSNQLTAHLIGYEVIHDIYREKGWEKPLVTYATVCFSTYWLDKLFTDIFLARSRGVTLQNIDEYLEHESETFHVVVDRIERPGRAKTVLARALERAFRTVLRRIHGQDRFIGLIEKVYSSKYERPLDIIAVDFYDPFLGDYLRLPHLEEIAELKPSFNIKHWEWVQNPKAFRVFLRAYADPGDVPVHVFENGTCNRVKGGVPIPRKDGWRRPSYLKAFLFELGRAIKEGARVEGYFHWSITDNYEWGSYEPRFGLIGIDYQDGSRRCDFDSLGDDSAGTYGEIISAMTGGSIREIKKAFHQYNP